MAMTRIDQYVKNLVRSTVFTAADVVKSDLAPDTVEFIQANKQVFTTTYSLLKNPKAGFKKSVEAIQDSKIYKALDYGLKNTLEDLRTGNFYNVERKDRDEARLAGMDASNMGDLSEFGIDDNWEKNLGNNTKPERSNVITSGDEAVINAVEGSISASTSANVNAIIGSADAMVKTSRANTAMLYAQNEKLFGAIHKDIMGIGSMMNEASKIQTAAMQNIDKNSSTYYTQSIKLDTERNAILKEMLEMQREMYKTSAAKEKAEKDKQSSKKKLRWSDVQYNGMVDLGNYSKLVNNNIKNLTSMFNIPGMGDDSNMLASMMVSPLQFALEFAVKGVIPATIKEATKELNDTIASVFGVTIGRMTKARRDDEGGIWGMLSKIFGINSDPNRTLDTSKYEKGAVPFDGITRKSIIEVIPSYLAKIEAHLLGSRERFYDYESGRWTKAQDVKKDFDKVKDRYEESASSEYMRDLNKATKNISFKSKSDFTRFEKAKKEMIKFIYETDGWINWEASAAANGVNPAKYPNLSDENVWTLITKTSKDMYTFMGANGKKNFKASKLMGITNKVRDAKDSEERWYREKENGDNALKAIMSQGFSNVDKHISYLDKDKKFMKVQSPYSTFKDEYGNSIFNYLQNINRELTYMRMYGGLRGKGTGSNNNLPNINTVIDLKNPNWNPNTTNSSQEDRDIEKLYQKALERARNGKAIVFSDLDRLDSEQLMNLMGAIRDAATDEHNANLRAMVESNALSSYLDERFGTDKSSLDQAKKRLSTGNKATDDDDEGIESSDPAEKNFIQKMVGKIRKYGSFSKAITSTGTEIFRDMLYSADAAIYNMFFKSELQGDDKKQKFKGMMDFMVNKINTTFDKVSDYFKNHVLDPLKEKLGINEENKKRFKDAFSGMAKGLGRMYVQANKDVFGEGYKYFTGEEYGSKKNKYGLTPDPTLKPIANKNLINEIYDTKQPTKTPATKGKQVGDTTAPVLDIDSLGGLAKGTMGRPFMGNSMLSKGELIFNSRGVSMINKTGAYRVNEPSHILNSEDSHTLLTGMGINAGPKHSIASSLAKEKAEKNRLFGTNARGISHHADADMKIEGTDFTLGELLETAKKYAPETAAGGAMGGLIGLLVGGPLIGAAIGGASMLIKNSDSLKDKLFGKLVDGEREGGFVPKVIQEKVSRYFPSMTKYGMAGLLPGLITPLGPIGGILVGAAFGFLKENEDFKKKYFGKEGKLTIGQKEQDILKKMFPAAGKGALAGVVASVALGGPFGILGSAALGAGLGMMGATDEFKDMLLGADIDGIRNGGLVGAFKDAIAPLGESMATLGKKLINTFDKNVVDPLSRFIKPAIHAIPQVLGIIPRKIGDALKDKVLKTSKTVMDKWFGKESVLGTMARGAIGAAAMPFKLATSPFKLFGMAGDAIRQRQVDTLNASYMTAEERMEFAKRRGKKVSGLDEMLAGANRADLSTLKDTIAYRLDNKEAISKKVKSSGADILRTLDSFQGSNGGKISTKGREKITKALNSGNIEGVMNILSKEGLSKEEFNQLMNKDVDLNSKLNKFKDFYERRNVAGNKTDTGLRESEKVIQEIIRKGGIKGFDINNNHDLEKLYATIAAELEHKDAMNPAQLEANEKEWELDKDRNTTLRELLKATNISNQLLGALNGLSVDEMNKSFNTGLDKLESGESKAEEVSDNLRGMAKILDNARNTKRLVNDKTDQINAKKEAMADRLIGRYADIDMEKAGAGEQLDKLREIASTPAPGMFKHGGSEAFMRASKRGMSINQLTLLGIEKTVIFDRFLKKTKTRGNQYDDKAALYIAELNPVDRDNLQKLILTKGFSNWLSVIKRPLNEKDIKAIPLLGANYKELGRKFDTAAKNPKKFKDVESVINMSTADWVHTDQGIIPTDEPTEESNGLGTLLLGGAKALLSGGAKLAGKIFGGRETSARSDGGGAVRVLSTPISTEVENSVGTSTAGNFDETDRAGDGRDVVPTSEGMALIKRSSDGSVDYDTTDSNTKSILQKLELRKRFSEKLQAAQMKASELSTKVFGETEEEKRKNKLDMLGAILGGTFLAKTGIFKKLFEGVIKPVWTNHIEPFFNDKVMPWIQNDLPNLIGNTISGAVELLTEKIPTIIEKAITVAVENMPTIIAAVLKGTGKGINKALQHLTGDDHGEGTETKTTRDNLTVGYDEHGNALTPEQLANASVIYNAQGVGATVNPDGTLTFADDSSEYATLAHTVGKASLKSFMHGGVFGAGLIGKGLNAMTKSKMPVAKLLGYAGKGIMAPINAAGNAGRGMANMIAARSVNAVNGIANPTLASDIFNRAGGNKLVSKAAGVGNKISSALNAGRDLNALNKVGSVFAKEATVGQKVMSKVAKGVDATKAVGSKVGTIISGLKAGLDKLFSNNVVLSKLGDIIKGLKNTKVVAGLMKMKDKLFSFFSKLIAGSAAKVGPKVVLKAASKVLFIMTIAQIVADFVLGCDQAEAILGVNQTDILEEFLCGIAKAVCGATVVLDIVPGVPAVAKMLCKFFNKDLNLEARRKEADAEYEQYKLETGSTESKDEYLKNTKSVSGKVGKVVGKVWGGVKSVGSWVGDKVSGVANVVGGAVGKAGEFIGGVVNKVGDVGKDLLDAVGKVGKYVVKGDVLGLMGYNTKVKGVETYEGNLAKPVIGMIKLLSFMPTVTSAIVHKIGDVIGGVIDVVKNAGIGVIDISKIVGSKMLKGDIAGLMEAKPPKYNNLIGDTAATMFTGISKLALFVPTLISAGVHFIGDNIGKIVNGVVAVGTGIANISTSLGSNLLDGDIAGLMEYKAPLYNNLLGDTAATMFAGIGKVALFLPTLISAGIHKVGEVLKPVVDGVIAVGNGIGAITTDLGSKVVDGDIAGLMEYAEPTYGNFMGDTASSMFTGIGKVALFVPTVISAGIHKVSDFVSNIATAGTEGMNKDNEIIDKVINGELSIFSAEYWDSGVKTDGIGGTIASGVTLLTRLIRTPIAIIGQIFKGLKEFLDGIVDWVGGFFGGVKEFFSDPLGFIYEKFTGEKYGESREPVESSSLHVKDENNPLYARFGGYGTRYGRGKYSKQTDPAIAGRRFNAKGDSSLQTIGDSACGPAAAVNVVESMYGRGGNAVLSAANMALKGGYKEKDGGTRPDFFGDYFSQHGLDSQMSTSRSQLAANINSGMPTVLMGSDANGTSGRTPYGKTPHYVTVTGTDGRGNAIVQDPEASKDDQLYNMNTLLSKSNLGVSAYGRGSKIPFHRILPTSAFGRLRGKWGRGEATVGADGLLTGKVINIPAGLGSYFVIEGWHTITSTQGTWQGRLKMKCENYDQEGFAKIGDRYVIACTTVYGVVGDYVDFYQSNGNVFKCIIGDIKSAGDANIGVYGHDHGKNVLEFICNRSWYGPPMHANPGTKSFHPEWGGQTMVKAINGGSFFTAAENLEQRKYLYKRYGGKYPGIGPNGEWAKVDGDTTSSGTMTNMGGVSGDATTGSTTTSTESQQPQGIFNLFSNLLDNSIAGKALSAFTGSMSGDSSLSSMASSGDSGSLASGERYTGDATGDPKKLLEVAASQVGTKEDHSRNDTQGRGWTKYGQWFGMPNEEWCAMFVSWAANQAGIPTSVIPKHTSTVDGAQRFPGLGGQLVTPQNASPGDIVYFYYPRAGRIAHVGIVEKGGDAVHTIEGNTGANIDEVKRQTYQFSDPSLNKIFRPNYAVPNGKNSVSSESSKILGDGPNTLAELASHGPKNKSTAKVTGTNVNISATGTRYGRGKPLSNLGTFKEAAKSSVPKLNAIPTDNGKDLVKEYKASGTKVGDVITYNGRRIAATGTNDRPKMMGADMTTNVIIQLLYRIADNSDKLNLIFQILSDKLNLKISSKDMHKATEVDRSLKRQIRSALSGNGENADSASIQDMISSMRLIASQ